MADDMGERTEAPSAKRLLDARMKGQVPKSTDLAGVITLFGGVLVVAVLGGTLLELFESTMRHMLNPPRDGEWMTKDTIVPTAKRAFGAVAIAMLPALAISATVGLVGQLVQVGFLFSAEPIRPKLTKLNPISGIKRIFGKKGLIKTVMSTAKLIVVLIVSYIVITSQVERLSVLPMMTAVGAMTSVMHAMIILVIWLLALLLLIAVADFLFQRWQHNDDLKMTKQEVKDERRSMDGDPQVKGKRMEMARSFINQRMGQAVPEADVVITNPTHFSVAIKYDTETMSAPKVTAKGVDELAMRIRQLARSNDVPIVERPPLARALYWGIDVGQTISAEHYEAVAEILAYVYRLEQRTPPGGKETAPINRTPQPVGA
ncbi:MAG: flagellar biosynthesis protein FlhB [Planctomycetota bacterium]